MAKFIRIEVDELEKARRKAERRERLERKKEEIKGFVRDNKEVIIVLAPSVIGAVVTGTKVIGKRVNLRKEENLKDLYCYDRSLGHYWALRRKLTNREWAEIDRRKRNGERLADILSELRVLK